MYTVFCKVPQYESGCKKSVSGSAGSGIYGRKDIDSLDNISVYYDKDWNQCDKEEKMYWLEVTQAQNQAQEDDLKKVKIAVYSGENSKGESSKKEEIYHLNLSIYIP